MPHSSSLELLKFFIRHQPYQSINAITGITGLDSGNLHSALSGRKPMSIKGWRRLGAAVGLDVKVTDGGLSDPYQLELIKGGSAHLEIDYKEVENLSGLLKQLTPTPPEWIQASVVSCGMFTDGQLTLDRPGVYSVAIARLGRSYLMLHVIYPSSEFLFDHPNLVGDQLWGPVREPNTSYGYPFDHLTWIRWRSGHASSVELDKLFGVSGEYSVEDWVRLMRAFSQTGLSADDMLERIQT